MSVGIKQRESAVALFVFLHAKQSQQTSLARPRIAQIRLIARARAFLEIINSNQPPGRPGQSLVWARFQRRGKRRPGCLLGPFCRRFVTLIRARDLFAIGQYRTRCACARSALGWSGLVWLFRQGRSEISSSPLTLRHLRLAAQCGWGQAGASVHDRWEEIYHWNEKEREERKKSAPPVPDCSRGTGRFELSTMIWLNRSCYIIFLLAPRLRAPLQRQSQPSANASGSWRLYLNLFTT